MRETYDKHLTLFTLLIIALFFYVLPVEMGKGTTPVVRIDTVKGVIQNDTLFISKK